MPTKPQAVEFEAWVLMYDDRDVIALDPPSIGPLLFIKASDAYRAAPNFAGEPRPVRCRITVQSMEDQDRD